MSELSVAFETSSTMRVLILSALLACASAAPVVFYVADESIAADAPGIAAPAVVGESEKADVKSAVDSEVKSDVVSEVKSEDKENVGVAAANYKSTEMKSESKKTPEEYLDYLIQEVEKLGFALQARRATYPTPIADAP